MRLVSSTRTSAAFLRLQSRSLTAARLPFLYSVVLLYVCCKDYASEASLSRVFAWRAACLSTAFSEQHI